MNYIGNEGQLLSGVRGCNSVTALVVNVGILYLSEDYSNFILAFKKKIALDKTVCP